MNGYDDWKCDAPEPECSCTADDSRDCANAVRADDGSLGAFDCDCPCHAPTPDKRLRL